LSEGLPSVAEEGQAVGVAGIVEPLARLAMGHERGLGGDGDRHII
jgi:hypothetical protein